jgi:hypothetical protein
LIRVVPRDLSPKIQMLSHGPQTRVDHNRPAGPPGRVLDSIYLLLSFDGTLADESRPNGV